MKFISKNGLGQFAKGSYTMHNAIEFFGKNPTHLGKYIRHKTAMKNGILGITEGMGNVLGADPNNLKAIKSIDSYMYTYDIESSQRPVVRFTRNVTPPSSLYTPFVIYLENDRYFKSDVISTRDNTLLSIISDAERISENEFKYTVVSKERNLVGTKFVSANEITWYITNNQPEQSNFIGSHDYYNVEKHANYLTKFRVGIEQTGDFAATSENYLITDKDQATAKSGGKFAAYSFTNIEQKLVDSFYTAVANALVFDKTTMNENNHRSFIMIDDHKQVVAGDGLVAQYERYGQIYNFSGKLRLAHFQQAIEHVVARRGQSMGNHITVLCNLRFSRMKADALLQAINVFTPNNAGAYFLAKAADLKKKSLSGNEIKDKEVGYVDLANEYSVGATLNTYVYEGNTITFMIDETLTKAYPDRAYGIFIDNSAYETESGAVPNLQVLTLKNKSLVRSYTLGVGGRDGRTSGEASTTAEQNTVSILGWRGLICRNPFAGFIIQEQI